MGTGTAVNLARVRWDDGDATRALAMTEEVLLAAPHDVDALSLKAEIELSLGEAARSAETAAAAIAADRARPEPFHTRALALRATGETDRARVAEDAALQRCRNAQQRGRYAFAYERYVDAGTAWSQAAGSATVDLERDRFLGSAGVAFARAGRAERAVPLLRASLRGWSRLLHTDLRCLLADQLCELGLHDEAWTLLPTHDELATSDLDLRPYRDLLTRRWPARAACAEEVGREHLAAALRDRGWATVRVDEDHLVIADAAGTVFHVARPDLQAAVDRGEVPHFALAFHLARGSVPTWSSWEVTVPDGPLRAPVDVARVLRWSDIAAEVDAAVAALTADRARHQRVDEWSRQVRAAIDADASLDVLSWARLTGEVAVLGTGLELDVQLHPDTDTERTEIAVRILEAEDDDEFTDHRLGPIPWHPSDLVDALADLATRHTAAAHPRTTRDDTALRRLDEVIEQAGYVTYETDAGLEVDLGDGRVLIVAASAAEVVEGGETWSAELLTDHGGHEPVPDLELDLRDVAGSIARVVAAASAPVAR